MSQPLLAVEGLMMRFGGLLAVNNVALLEIEAETRRAGMSQPLLAVEGLMMRFGGLLAVNNVAL